MPPSTRTVAATRGEPPGLATLIAQAAPAGKAATNDIGQPLDSALSSQATAPPGGDAAATSPLSGSITLTPLPAGAAIPTYATQDAVLSGGGEPVDTVALRVARAMRDGTQTLSIELHPAELGRVEVRLSFQDGGVGVQMTLDRQETYAAFHRDRAALEQQLAQAGIDLGSGGLDLRYGQQSRQPLPQQATATFRADASAAAVPLEVRPLNDQSADGLVDIIA
jgi:flagellar hook-length control protein FliK